MIDTIKTLEIIHHIPIARHSAPNVLDSAASSPLQAPTIDST